MCCILLLMLHTLHLLLRSIQMYLPAHQLLRVLLPCLWLTNSHLKTVGWCVTKEQVPSTKMNGGYPLSGSKLRSCPLVCLAQSSKSLIGKDSDSQKLMLTLCFVANEYAFLIRKDSDSQKLVIIYWAKMAWNTFSYYKGSTSYQPVRLAGSYRCWFMKKYCWLVCVREKYCSVWKFTIVYDKPQPNEQAD